MLRKLKYIIIGATLMLSTTACLDKVPGSAIPESEALQTISDAQQIVSGIYSSLKGGDLYSGKLALLPDIQADFVHAVEANSNVYGSFWRWDFRSTTAEVESVYASLYSVIGDCNFFLDQKDRVKESITNDDDLDLLETLTAEVYTIRALMYSELIKVYCQAYPATDEQAKGMLGVVLSDSFFNHAEPIRATLYDSYQFVIADLERALDLFADDDEGAGNIYLSQGAAQSLMARVALYMRDWDRAVEYSSKLIDDKSDLYELTNANTLYADPATGEGVSAYRYMWQYDASNEIIWTIGFTSTSYGGKLGSVFFNMERDYYNYYPDYIISEKALKNYAYSDLRTGANFIRKATGYSSGLEATMLYKYFGNSTYFSSMIFGLCQPKPFRLSEQYLIRAEAFAMLGKYSAASADLTALRQNRYKSGSGTVSVNAENYMEVIEQERICELFMEGFRLQDLKRWGKGFEREMQSGAQAEGATLKINADNPRFVWPIPIHELEAPGSMIQPNPSNNL